MSPNEIIIQTLSIFMVVTLICIWFKHLLQIWIEANVLAKNHDNRELRMIKHLFDKLPLLLISFMPLTFWVVINIMLMHGVTGEVCIISSIFLTAVVFIQFISGSGPFDL